MTDQLNIVLHIEDEPDLVIESNINLKPSDKELYAQVWRLPEEVGKTFKPNKLLKTFNGRYAIVDAVSYLSELVGEPIAHRLRKVN
jgi:hypothetical protein